MLTSVNVFRRNPNSQREAGKKGREKEAMRELKALSLSPSNFLSLSLKATTEITDYRTKQSDWSVRQLFSCWYSDDEYAYVHHQCFYRCTSNGSTAR